MSEKKTIVFLFPGPIYRPDLPNFKDRFEMLSESFEGEIYSWTCDQQFREYRIGDFVFRGLVDPSGGLLKKWRLARHIISCARRYHKRKRVDVVVCYDPMFTGVVGAFLKLLMGVRVIVEINSEHYGGALTAFYGKGIRIQIKKVIFKALCFFALFLTDGVKVLMEKTRMSLPGIFQKKRIFIFHDFVPTHYFKGDGNMSREILFVGHPFHLKGVDTLIQAFHKIQKQHPEFLLRLAGHRLREDAEIFFAGHQFDDRIIFHKGMAYDELKKFFLNCYCFVLSSRTEGMGRVLLEAMASGKPVIGSNVGGIPSLIEDGRNGFLFESENVDDLADKLQRLLSDPTLARRMGEESRRIVEEKFSSEKYVENFRKMVDEIL